MQEARQTLPARFGVTPHVVRQRLRLGRGLAQADAGLRDGEMALDQLMAFASPRIMPRQEAVYERPINWRKPSHST
jgi:ParB family chromosome partitioning protein